MPNKIKGLIDFWLKTLGIVMVGLLLANSIDFTYKQYKEFKVRPLEVTLYCPTENSNSSTTIIVFKPKDEDLKKCFKDNLILRQYQCFQGVCEIKFDFINKF